MKKLFFSAIPICLVSFILFGITVAFMGTKFYGGDTVGIGGYNDYGTVTFIDQEVSGTGEWTLTDVVEPNVTLRTSGVKAYVIQSVDECIHLRVNGNRIAVKAESNGDALELEVHPPEITFSDIINFGQILWSEDIFHGSPSAEVVIAFPKLIYASLNIQHGSGTLMVDGFNAANNDFDIGSGRFEFSKSDQYTADYFDIDIGSGSAVMSNLQSRRYNIDLGSGYYDLSGLSGYGEIDMGSGKGSIAYSTFMGIRYDYSGDVCRLNIGSGLLDLYFPDDEGCRLYTDIGSGSIIVDAYGVQKKFTHGSDEDELILGDENDRYYHIDMGSGKVNIRNTSTYTKPEMFEGRPDNVEELGMIKGVVIDGSGEWVTNFSTSYNVAEQVPPVYSSSSIDQVTITGSLPGDLTSGSSQNQSGNESAGSTSLPAPPEAPQAPDAPSAPEAPEPPEAPSAPEAPDAPTEPEESDVPTV